MTFSQKLIFAISIPLLYLSINCKEEPPVKNNGDVPPPTNPLQMKIEDVTCTEAFLKISLSVSEENRNVMLKRNDSTLFSNLQLFTTDTMIIDEGLLPSNTYTYTLNYGEWDTTAQVATMNTTSQNWIWTIDTLGESGSYLVDVAILNDTLAYAVGEIHVGDSLYNAAKWDGKNWKPMKILFYTICGQEYRTPYPASSVIAFSPTDIWFAMSGSQIARWNGTSQTAIICLPVSFSISKLWGNNSNSIYAVGYNGSNGIILYYNGNTWQSMGSGTTLALTDIHGTLSGEIYACGINYSQSTGVILINSGTGWKTMIESGTIDSTELFKTKLYAITEGLWIDETGAIFVVGNLFYRYKFKQWDYVNSLPGNKINGNSGYQYRGYLHAVAGNKSNDMFIVGEINTARHFNGLTWQQIGLPYHPLNYGMFWYGCSVINDLMIAVGKNNGRASILSAKRK